MWPMAAHNYNLQSEDKKNNKTGQVILRTVKGLTCLMGEDELENLEYGLTKDLHDTRSSLTALTLYKIDFILHVKSEILFTFVH
jgi:hypothetical protein